MRAFVIAAAMVLVVATLLFLLVLSWNPDSGDRGQGVLLKLDKTELRGERTLTYTLVNGAGSEGDVCFGEPYDVQILKDDSWATAEWMRDRVWIAILWRLKPNESFSRQVQLPDDVKPGTYRLVKEVQFCDSGQRLTLTAEFVVLE
ncbi:MAG: hypothetical protein QXP81_07515 [Nitrososphaerota archaeon]|nr:hypothetical protein [Candidatus Calditenuis fumarioli]